MREAIWVKCNGEAHQPSAGGMIDHCMICMPYWGSFPICPDCNQKLTEKGYCRKCRHYFTT
jgi:hypothetical protein